MFWIKLINSGSTLHSSSCEPPELFSQNHDALFFCRRERKGFIPKSKRAKYQKKLHTWTNQSLSGRTLSLGYDDLQTHINGLVIDRYGTMVTPLSIEVCILSVSISSLVLIVFVFDVLCVISRKTSRMLSKRLDTAYVIAFYLKTPNKFAVWFCNDSRSSICCNSTFF